mgnify:CR=1 FL=1
MKIHKPFPFKILLPLALIVLAVLSNHIASGQTRNGIVDNTFAAPQNRATPTIIFNGVSYSYEEFQSDFVTKYERIIYLDSRWMGDDNNIWYAFTNANDMSAFAATNDVDVTSDPATKTQPDILPTEIQLDSS